MYLAGFQWVLQYMRASWDLISETNCQLAVFPGQAMCERGRERTQRKGYALVNGYLPLGGEKLLNNSGKIEVDL